MLNTDIKEEVLQIADALRKGGYDPEKQFKGYLQTKDANYITRRDGARERIRRIDMPNLRKVLYELYGLV